jgi:2-dehydro-3-deoxyphosphogluconate aldolase / (4S)-4-hydroxy-2-oxoglutarate aldolase
MPQNATPARARTIDGLADAVLVAVVREVSEARAQAFSEALLEGGLRALEITANTPGAFAALESLDRAGASRHAVLGIGTVKTSEDVARTRAAGGAFVVSPHTDPSIIESAHRDELVAIPGALTPTEIMAARTAGADFVKIFPVSAVGGARYLRLLRAPLGGLPLWVSGSVALEEIEEMVGAGAALIGLTSALLADLPDDLAAARTAVRARAQSALEALARAKSGRPLLTIRGAEGSKHFALSEIRGGERARLEDLLPERRGNAVRLRSFLEVARVPPGAMVEVRSADGAFVRQVAAKTLLDGGWLHYATDGEPLPRSAGGPLRLYVIGGDSSCDNVKGLAEIAVLP